MSRKTWFGLLAMQRSGKLVAIGSNEHQKVAIGLPWGLTLCPDLEWTVRAFWITMVTSWFILVYKYRYVNVHTLIFAQILRRWESKCIHAEMTTNCLPWRRVGTNQQHWLLVMHNDVKTNRNRADRQGIVQQPVSGEMIAVVSQLHLELVTFGADSTSTWLHFHLIAFEPLAVRLDCRELIAIQVDS